MSTTTATRTLAVSAPRGTLTHLDRVLPGQEFDGTGVTSCGRKYGATWHAQELRTSADAPELVTCPACYAWALHHRDADAAAAAEEQARPQWEQELLDEEPAVAAGAACTWSATCVQPAVGRRRGPFTAGRTMAYHVCAAHSGPDLDADGRPARFEDAQPATPCSRCGQDAAHPVHGGRHGHAYDVAPAVPATPHTVLVVPCSGKKLDHAAPARELYRGTLTTMGLAAAASIAQAHVGTSTLILSALHGLLDPELVVAPYDLRMGDPGSVDTDTLADQLQQAGATRVVALTPGTYTAALAAACEAAGLELVAPLAGSRGIGEQRGRLAQLRRGAGLGRPGQPGGSPVDLGLETRRVAADHALALEQYRAWQLEQLLALEDVTPEQERQVEAALAAQLPTVDELRRAPQVPELAELLARRSRTAVRRLEANRRAAALSRAVASLPPAFPGTGRTC
jgi:hypothetical protein